MSQPRHRLLPRIATTSLIAATALLPVAALAPDSATQTIVDHGPTAGIALIVAAGGATLIARWPRRRPVSLAAPAALPPAHLALSLPTGHPHRNARTVQAVRAGQSRNELPTAGPARRELPAASTGGVR